MTCGFFNALMRSLLFTGLLLSASCSQKSSRNQEQTDSLKTTPAVAPQAKLASPDNADSAVNVLHNANPKASWNKDSMMVADVTCDGVPETLMLGSEGNQVLVGIISAKQSKPEVLSFSIRADQQDGFCEMAKRITIEPLDCESSEGKLPDCKPSKSCHAFAVEDGACDSFHFYWSTESKDLTWWRL